MGMGSRCNGYKELRSRRYFWGSILNFLGTEAWDQRGRRVALVILSVRFLNQWPFFNFN
jgi:hypothetical protein